MPSWIPYFAVFLFLIATVYVKPLSRSGDFKISPSDWNVGAPAAASGVLLVVNFLIGKSPSLFDDSDKWRLGVFLSISFVTFIVSLSIARGIDEAIKGPGEKPEWQRKCMLVLGPILSLVSATICVGLALSFK